MADRLRLSSAFFALIVTLLVVVPVFGQVRSRRGRPAAPDLTKSTTTETGRPRQYVVTGLIERRDNRHVLVDGDGELEAYLIPKASLDMERFVGKTVELTVREPLSRKDGEPRYWVDEVSSVSSTDPARFVSLLRFPITASC